jgi:hypothetical protein
MRRTLVLVLFLITTNTWGCGYCVEDKIASAYDHALVTRALGAGHHVAFYHLEGPLAQDAATRRAIVAAAESAPGVDKGSVRVAPETLTLSFAFDPRRTSLAAAEKAIDQRLASRRLSLYPLRVIEKAAELKEVTRR